ncbi:hypothetical protein ACFX2I_000106 [Malus domestica]
MASWVLFEYGLKPLPQVWNRPRTTVCSSYPSKVHIFWSNQSSADLRWDLTKVIGGLFRERRWGLNVSVSLRVASVEEEEKGVNGVNGGEDGEKEVGFDPSAPLPFKLANVKAAIPKHCWVRDQYRSMSYVVRDVAVVFKLAAAAVYVDKCFVWPLYWATQGTMY